LRFYLMPRTQYLAPSTLLFSQWLSFITKIPPCPQYGKRKRERLSTLPLPNSGDNPDQVQTITPVELLQVLAESEWVAVALQACGGPATIVAVTVTFCEGVKP
jgi:hypothetical protein